MPTYKSTQQKIRSPYDSEYTLQKKLAFLYLGTRGRLPNEDELQKEMDTHLSSDNYRQPILSDETDVEETAEITKPNSCAKRVYSDKKILIQSNRSKQNNEKKNIFNIKDSMKKSDWYFVKNIIMSKPYYDQLGNLSRQNKPEFNLTSNIHLPDNYYNSLKDYYLKAYYTDDKKKDHLKNMCLLTPNNYIVENPNAYEKVKDMF